MWDYFFSFPELLTQLISGTNDYLYWLFCSWWYHWHCLLVARQDPKGCGLQKLSVSVFPCVHVATRPLLCDIQSLVGARHWVAAGAFLRSQLHYHRRIRKRNQPARYFCYDARHRCRCGRWLWYVLLNSLEQNRARLDSSSELLADKYLLLPDCGQRHIPITESNKIFNMMGIPVF